MNIYGERRYFFRKLIAMGWLGILVLSFTAIFMEVNIDGIGGVVAGYGAFSGIVWAADYATKPKD
jgi:hypothetical protein